MRVSVENWRGKLPLNAADSLLRQGTGEQLSWEPRTGWLLLQGCLTTPETRPIMRPYSPHLFWYCHIF